MMLKNEVIGNEVVVYADMNLYSKDSIFKCLYWYGDKYHTNISLVEKKYYRISLRSSEESTSSKDSLDLLLLKLERDLVDFNLRDIVAKETQNIRDLLVAKAFSNGEFDELPPGEISDPVGFSV